MLALLAILLAFTMPSIMVWCLWRHSFAGLLAFFGCFMLWVIAIKITELIIGHTWISPGYFVYTIGFAVAMFTEGTLTALYLDRREKRRNKQPPTA